MARKPKRTIRPVARPKSIEVKPTRAFPAGWELDYQRRCDAKNALAQARRKKRTEEEAA